MPYAIEIVHRFFPKVTKVIDGKTSLTIDVTKADAASRAVRDHRQCAMAVACTRKMHLDGAIISRTAAYLIKNKVATRYRVPASVAREVVAFDRGGRFAPGEYELLKVGPQHALGVTRGGGKHTETGKKPKRTTPKHFTSGIRTALSGVPAK